MPAIATSPALRDREGGVDIALSVHHVLSVAAPLGRMRAVQDPPSNVDVILHANLIISIAGTQGNQNVGGCVMRCSAIAQHLLQYLQRNSEWLGVMPVSNIFLDDADGEAKLMLRSNRPILERRTPCFHLLELHLLYAAHTPTSHDIKNGHTEPGAMMVAVDPFSPYAFTPFVRELDRITENFASLELVRRYPLIFGPWRERYDAEKFASSKISLSITEIIDRSPHTAFRERSCRIIKALHRQCESAESISMAALLEARSLLDADAFATSSPDCGDSSPVMDGQETLSQAMDLMLKASPKTTRIKVPPKSRKERSLELTGGFSKHVRPVAPGARSTGASVDNLHLFDAGLGMAMGESTAKRKIWADGLEARGFSEVGFGDETDFVGENRELFIPHALQVLGFVYGTNEDTFNTSHAVDSPEIELVSWSSHADLAHGKPASDSIQDADQPLYQTLMEQPHTTATGLSPKDFQPDVDDLERYAASMSSDSLYRPSFDATPGLVLSDNALCHDAEEVCGYSRAWFSGSGPDLGVTASWLIQGSSGDTTLSTRNPCQPHVYKSADGNAALLFGEARSGSSAGAVKAIDRLEERRDGAHEVNEGSLVARDVWHAMSIRPWTSGEVGVDIQAELESLYHDRDRPESPDTK